MSNKLDEDYDNYPILSVAGQDRMHGNDLKKANNI